MLLDQYWYYSEYPEFQTKWIICEEAEPMRLTGIRRGYQARQFRVYKNGNPNRGGQWFYTVADAQARIKEEIKALERCEKDRNNRVRYEQAQTMRVRVISYRNGAEPPKSKFFDKPAEWGAF